MWGSSNRDGYLAGVLLRPCTLGALLVQLGVLRQERRVTSAALVRMRHRSTRRQ